jgi:hypothetical protein
MMKNNPEMMKENHAKMMGMMKENPEMMKSDAGNDENDGG